MVHTLVSMDNDTPADGPLDSHDPFTSLRNEDTDAGVSTNMNDTTPTPSQTEAVPPDIDPIEPTSFDYDSYYGAEDTWSAPTQPSTPAPIPVAPPKKTRDGAMFFVGVLAAAILGAALTVGLLAATGTFSSDTSPIPEAGAAAVVANQTPTTAGATVTNQIINDLGAAVNPSAVALKVVPSIVTVTTFNEAPDSEDLVGSGSGSGVVISEDGYIATNEHVVNGATNYRVTFEDGRVYDATLIGSDDLTDLAVLQISADNLVPIEFGSASALSLGDPAVAVGNPLGQEGGSSISAGIVSAFNRQVDFGDGSTLFGMIQTDAAINSGSSGGSLVNAEGQLIGITSAIGVSTAGPEGIGYAIPVELVQRITAEIIETGDVEHPFLGVTISTFAEEQADGAIQPIGADVISVETTDYGAGAAGIEAGDVVVQIGPKDIASRNDLILAVRLYRVGDEVEFVVLRDGELMTFDVVMGQRPPEQQG
jgi:serine protease Do